MGATEFRRTLVVGDIHGAHKALVQVLERSAFDPQQDRLISLGDLTDYHPDNAEVIDTLLAIPHLIAVRGNHDTWVQEYLETGDPDTVWLHNGGEQTTESLYYLRSETQERYRRFFMNQKRYFIDEANRLFVHAGITPRIPIDMQRDAILYWDRALWTQAARWNEYGEPFPDHPFLEIYIGHTPTNKYWPDARPIHFGNIWNLDQGIKRTGKLSIMDVATKDYWQSDFAVDLYPMSNL